ncbi:hypothetical protein MEPL4_4c00490 [Melissococcus plutonius]|uniref:LSM domain-containing protein n=1 Tax=Melissococcus plutonius (strain ATCC 35311 / DSM 29964 / CIP 104052 / LMG 20360 / NCIMB 702443) TaxID=940190 RepID=F3YBI0_MELPT|nr:hypothetical protein [Melissococcus plutonius]AIM25770.1 hypothetical protein MEPL_c010300 [Melissococcus plutonius S1]KMT23461.1 hypothetical protein MEPL2_43p00430 [Melissococcus plutonius]KMT25219.1 hypothetical protein MEPL2_2c07770 [Melissococcus plutonius]KMT26125.1 hypothetical protein MEPL3_3c00500 [Melissococcus plutonius]KMT26855.1 hypothetical protein MEPL1_4c00500 [Melissococcus plutonius]
MGVKITVTLKNGGYVTGIICDTKEANLWIENYVKKEKYWITVGEFPRGTMIPVNNILLINFTEENE